jgi:hypothetical protein
MKMAKKISNIIPSNISTEDEINFTRIQGMFIIFFKVLNESTDHRLIFEIFMDISIDTELVGLDKNMFFPMLNMNVEMLITEKQLLVDKLIWALAENDCDEETIAWLKDGVNRFQE